MHSLSALVSLRSLALFAASLPATVFSAPHPIPFVARSHPEGHGQRPPLHIVLENVHTEHNATTAGLTLSCPGCLASASSHRGLDLAFDLSLAPGSEPCASNITVNSVPLDYPIPQSSDSPLFWRGGFNIVDSGHEYLVNYGRSCEEHTLDDSARSSEVLSFVVASVDGQQIDTQPRPGFTLSFRDSDPVEILRVAAPAVGPQDIDASWYHPSADERTSVRASTKDRDLSIQENIEELERLEAYREAIDERIRAKKTLISGQLVEELKGNVKQCDGPVCVVKSVWHHVNKSLKLVCNRLLPQSDGSDRDATQPPRNQSPTMITDIENDAASAAPPSYPGCPEKAHCRDEKTVNGYLTVGSNETRIDELPPRESAKPSKLHTILQYFLLFTGITLVFTLLRKCAGCCCSPRKRRERRERREEARRGCEYRRAARRQGFWDWMNGRPRGHPGRRPGDLEEKAALVHKQEAYLDENMQDEIRQLQIHDEIQQIRHTRDAVNDLIRSEGDRNVAAPAYHPHPFGNYPRGMVEHRNSYPTVPGASFIPGASTVPAPIRIPARNSGLRATGPFADGAHSDAENSPLPSPASSSDMPYTPFSRTTSLPSYRSKPPSYREDESSDAFSDDDGVGDGYGWASDNSSIPDLSPRPSGETMRTFETTRTFV